MVTPRAGAGAGAGLAAPDVGTGIPRAFALGARRLTLTGTRSGQVP